MTNRGSDRQQIGGGGATLDTPFAPPLLPHDIIRFFPKTKDRIFEVCFPLYESGFSLREIEEQTGFAKSSIRDTLASRGLTLRSNLKKPKVKTQPSAKLRSPILPYGYAWLEGKLVVEPREYKIILEIMKLWHSGQSLTSIATYLNGQSVPTRMGKEWFHSSVRAIIKRQKGRR